MQARSSAVPRTAGPKAFPAARSFAAAAIESAPARRAADLVFHLAPLWLAVIAHAASTNLWGDLVQSLGEAPRAQRLALTIALGRLAGQELFSVRRPASQRLWCCGRRLQAEQCSEKCGRSEIMKVGLLDESAGFDEAACALLSLLILDAGFLLGKAGLLLSEAAHALGKGDAGHAGSPW